MGLRQLSKPALCHHSSEREKIEEKAFVNCTSLAEIIFEGTRAEWTAVEKQSGWMSGVPSPLTVNCKDGQCTER